MRKNLRPEQVDDLLTQARIAVLATYSADGSMFLTPIWHEWADGGFTAVLDGTDAKMRNLKRDPRCSIVVAEDQPPYRGIEVRGEARLTDTGAPAVLRRMAERYLKGRDVEAYLNRMRGWGENALVVRIEPGVLRAWDFADEEW